MLLNDKFLQLMRNISLNKVRHIFITAELLKAFNMLMWHVNPQKEKYNILDFKKLFSYEIFFHWTQMQELALRGRDKFLRQRRRVKLKYQFEALRGYKDLEERELESSAESSKYSTEHKR